MMNFGEALEKLRSGEKVARTGWNGKNMWIHLAQGPSVDHRQYLEMRDAQGFFVPWMASQTDLLADDWAVVVP